jgi:hypothetical protein
MGEVQLLGYQNEWDHPPHHRFADDEILPHLTPFHLRGLLHFRAFSAVPSLPEKLSFPAESHAEVPIEVDLLGEATSAV